MKPQHVLSMLILLLPSSLTCQEKENYENVTRQFVDLYLKPIKGEVSYESTKFLFTSDFNLLISRYSKDVKTRQQQDPARNPFTPVESLLSIWLEEPTTVSKFSKLENNNSATVILECYWGKGKDDEYGKAYVFLYFKKSEIGWRINDIRHSRDWQKPGPSWLRDYLQL